jgi:hypothetical protein
MKKVLISCAAVLVLCFMVAVASAADKSTTINGYVSDSMCGAKGANASHAACMTKCLGKGAKAVIVTDSDSKVVNVDNPDEAHHVAVTGEMKGDTIHIESVKML